jgi:hypothetical protein
VSTGNNGLTARNADRWEIYQKAVQNPGSDIGIITERFREMRGREPLSLREDFAGTALLSAEWVRGDANRRAVAVDIDEEALTWGAEHNLAPLGEEAAGRVELVAADVREVRGYRADVVSAMNFSFNALTSRADLLRYLAGVHEAIGPEGILVLEMYGGTEAIVATAEEREGDGFTYHWEQERYNPLTGETRCHIGFTFPDGSQLKRAFSYDWRLWTLPEVRDCLTESGFSHISIFWEQVDDEGAGTGEYVETAEEENQETWLVYIVAAH